MITTITGKNSFLAQQHLRQRTQAFVDAHGSVGVREIDGEDATIDVLREAVMSQGLFSTESFVVLRGVAANKQLQEDVVEMLSQIPDETTLVIFEPALDRRTVLFKTLKHETEFVDCVELDERELVEWARNYAQENNFELGIGEAQLLVQRVDADQWLLFHELSKLREVEGDITKETITALVEESFTQTIFNLLDDAFAGRGQKATATYHQMVRNKVDVYLVFSMIVWQLHILALIVFAESRSPEQIAKENKLSPFVVKKVSGIAKRTSRRDVLRILDKASETDVASKTKAAFDMEAAVDVLIARIAS